VTGPGGVLWGAQSFMGVYNIITKDAEDVPGTVELSAGYGDGRGDRSDFRVSCFRPTKNKRQSYV